MYHDHIRIYTKLFILAYSCTYVPSLADFSKIPQSLLTMIFKEWHARFVVRESNTLTTSDAMKRLKQIILEQQPGAGFLEEPDQLIQQIAVSDYSIIVQ
jgi:hypothetical protein